MVSKRIRNESGVISVSPEHIQLGIMKYEAIVDQELTTLIKHAGLSYTPYVFRDGRILLVLPNNIGGLLYGNKAILFETLNLSS